jgi:hypothetical protein
LDPLGDERLQAPEIAIPDPELLEVCDSVVEILRASSPMPGRDCEDIGDLFERELASIERAVAVHYKAKGANRATLRLRPKPVWRGSRRVHHQLTAKQPVEDRGSLIRGNAQDHALTLTGSVANFLFQSFSYCSLG